MSSKVRKRDRIKREPRTSFEEFSEIEQEAILAAKQSFGSPVVVFGSRARGDWADDSDLDIGVSGYHYHNSKPLVSHINKNLRIKVDFFKIENARTHNGAIEL